MDKFDLLVLLIDKHSVLLNASGQALNMLKHQHAKETSMLVAILLGDGARRIIAGERASEVDSITLFEDGEGKHDLVLSTHTWIYEAQANLLSDSKAEIKTAIFVDIAEDLAKEHSISPASILAGLKGGECYLKSTSDDDCTFVHVPVSAIQRYEALALSGDEEALYKLGLAYATGEGVQPNSPKAQMLPYKAYLHGKIDAIYALVDLSGGSNEHFLREASKHR